MTDWLFIAVIYVTGSATGALAMAWVYTRDNRKARAQAASYRRLWLAELAERDRHGR
jgi:hypothetical protein